MCARLDAHAPAWPARGAGPARARIDLWLHKVGQLQVSHQYSVHLQAVYLTPRLDLNLTQTLQGLVSIHRLQH